MRLKKNLVKEIQRVPGSYKAGSKVCWQAHPKLNIVYPEMKIWKKNQDWLS